MDTMVNSEVKAGIVLGWLTFLAFEFRCTLPQMVHSIIVGLYPDELDIFNQPCGNPELALGGERCRPACPCLSTVFTFERRQ